MRSGRGFNLSLSVSDRVALALIGLVILLLKHYLKE